MKSNSSSAAAGITNLPGIFPPGTSCRAASGKFYFRRCSPIRMVRGAGWMRACLPNGFWRIVCLCASACNCTNSFGIHPSAEFERSPGDMEQKPKAVILVSGGMDSCVTAAIASTSHRLAFLHASYGQRTERRERAAFEAIADFFAVRERLVVQLDHLKAK